jgi:protein gp37
MENSSIAWTHHTFNPWIGCSRVSPGCEHCYAETLMDTRYHRAKWGPTGTRVRTSEDNWAKPKKWNAKASALGVRYRVFCASLADVFEPRPELATWRDELHELVRDTPNLDWLVLTKRPEVAADYYGRNGIPGNVWIGTTVEDRDRAEKRIPILRSIPARVRFLSVEPLLGDLGDLDLTGIAWVIVGGESGPGFRAMAPEWARNVREQCERRNTPFFFKQWSGRSPAKNPALDGKLHAAYP